LLSFSQTNAGDELEDASLFSPQMLEGEKRGNTAHHAGPGSRKGGAERHGSGAETTFL